MQDKAVVRNTSAVFAEVIGYLNRHEFFRSSSASGPLAMSSDRICAHYASLQLDSLFQPLFDIRSRRVAGHEALLAGQAGNDVSLLGSVLSPDRVFTLAANEDITFLDRLARTLHTLNFLLQHAGGFLHLNVHPHHLLAVSADHGRVFEGILKQCGLHTRQIVLEVAEHAVPDKQRLALAVAAWQEKGYHIAIDGFGRERASLRRVLKLRPQQLKLDRSVLRNILRSQRGLATLERVVREAQDAGVIVVATGVESPAVLDLLWQTGIARAQGYLFGRPQPYCVLV